MFSTRLMSPDAGASSDSPIEEEESLKKHGDKLDPEKLSGIPAAANAGAREGQEQRTPEPDSQVAPRSSATGDPEAEKRDAVSRQR